MNASNRPAPKYRPLPPASKARLKWERNTRLFCLLPIFGALAVVAVASFSSGAAVSARSLPEKPEFKVDMETREWISETEFVVEISNSTPTTVTIEWFAYDPYEPWEKAGTFEVGPGWIVDLPFTCDVTDTIGYEVTLPTPIGPIPFVVDEPIDLDQPIDDSTTPEREEGEACSDCHVVYEEMLCATR